MFRNKEITYIDYIFYLFSINKAIIIFKYHKIELDIHIIEKYHLFLPICF